MPKGIRDLNETAEVISIAITRERASVEYYKAAYEKAETENARAIFARMIEEEEIHEAKLRLQLNEIQFEMGKEGLLHSTLDTMLEGCQIIDRKWRYAYVNDAGAKQGRREKEQLLNYTMMEVYPGIEKTEVFGHIRDCMNKRVPYQMENEFIFPDGSKSWAELRIEPVPEGVMILSLDITERRRVEKALQQSEERFRSLFEKSPICNELYDAEGKLITVNKACLELFGVSNVSQVKGFKLFEDPNVTTDVKERLRRGETIRWETTFDFELVKKFRLYPTSRSGTMRIDVLLTPLDDTPSTISGYLVVVQEISDRDKNKASQPNS